MKIIPYQYQGGTGYEVTLGRMELALILVATGKFHPTDALKAVDHVNQSPAAGDEGSNGN